MSNKDGHGIDTNVAAFFNDVVAEAFQTITNEYLKRTVRSKTRIDSNSAEILIYYDPQRDYKGYLYRLQVREGVLWRKSFNTKQTHVTPASENVMVRYDYTLSTAESIVADFVSQYQDDRATKPLGEAED